MHTFRRFCETLRTPFCVWPLQEASARVVPSVPEQAGSQATMTIPLDHVNVSHTQNGNPEAIIGPGDMDYLVIDTGSAALDIQIQLDALDGIARDVIEGFKALPRRGIEVGGLLLGHVERYQERGRVTVLIERFQRISCEHKFGPQYVLDGQDQTRLEEAAASITESGELTVLGTYRSHTRAGFQLEDSDLAFVDRYFRDPSDLMLLIKPESAIELQAQFFVRDQSGRMEQAGDIFAFHGRMFGMLATFGNQVNGNDDTADIVSDGKPLLAEPERASVFASLQDTAELPESIIPPTSFGTANPPAVELPPAASEPARFRAPRIIPDFVPAGDAPNPRPMFRTLENIRNSDDSDSSDHGEERGFFARWWPLLGAILLVFGALAILFWPSISSYGRGVVSERTSAAASPSPGTETDTFRPLGLYVDPSGRDWRITWNQTATPLANARAVGLFVREGDDQNRIDLSPDDLKNGTYQYKPKGNDVTFRLEVTDASGRVSAESFRVTNSGPEREVRKSAPEPPKAVKPVAVSHSVGPKATHKVPPVIPAGIRPRIHGSIPIDVRVKVDIKGRVTAAAPLKKHSGLEAFLADRAVVAAKQWRFTPATQDGKAIVGTQTIHFVFDR